MKASVWAVVAIIMAGLYGLDKSLAALEAREVASQARHLYQQGSTELAGGGSQNAVNLLTRAHALERDNREYLLALAAAQRKDGRADDARASLDLLLTADSNDADANLEMARLLVSGKRFGEAESFYHRALFGDGMKDPVNVRLELAALLAQQNKSQELLAELLLLEDQAEKDPRVARLVAGLFLRAGSVNRAAQMYRALIRMNADDQEAQTGLGEVELQEGNYRAAQSAFAKAGDAAKRQLADTLAGLDPTLRRLSSAEKYARSSQVLQLTATACGQTADVTQIRTATNEAAEALLDRAAAIWKAGGCRTGEADALAILQKKIAQ